MPIGVNTCYTKVSCMHIQFKHIAYIKVISTLIFLHIYFKHIAYVKVISTFMIQYYIEYPRSTVLFFFPHKVLTATAESIEQLTGLKGTPLAYPLSPGLPVEDTVLGPVQLSSPLPHHVSMALSFNSSIVQAFLKMSRKFVRKLHTNQISLMIGNSLIWDFMTY